MTAELRLMSVHAHADDESITMGGLLATCHDRGIRTANICCTDGKLATIVALLSLFYHAWVGIRDIWMDYVKPVGLRLFLQVATILWLVGCIGYAAQILWRV